MTERRAPLGFMGFGEAGYHLARGLRGAGAPPLVAFDINARNGSMGERIRGRAMETGTHLVETPADLLMMEQTLAYNGRYFVLMGRLAPLDGVGPREIGLDVLKRRVGDGVVKEVIVATNFTNEGEATAHYIGELLKDQGVSVSRIARGIPVGGELEFVDAGTLAQAFVERRKV